MNIIIHLRILKGLEYLDKPVDPTPGLTGHIFRERLAIPTRPWFKSIQLKIFIMMDEFSQLIRCDWIYKEILS